MTMTTDTIMRYDSNGNLIYSGNNDYWIHHEYDSNGSLIYSKDSNGKIKDWR